MSGTDEGPDVPDSNFSPPSMQTRAVDVLQLALGTDAPMVVQAAMTAPSAPALSLALFLTRSSRPTWTADIEVTLSCNLHLKD